MQYNGEFRAHVSSKNLGDNGEAPFHKFPPHRAVDGSIGHDEIQGCWHID